MSLRPAKQQHRRMHRQHFGIVWYKLPASVNRWIIVQLYNMVEARILSRARRQRALQRAHIADRGRASDRNGASCGPPAVTSTSISAGVFDHQRRILYEYTRTSYVFRERPQPNEDHTRSLLSRQCLSANRLKKSNFEEVAASELPLKLRQRRGCWVSLQGRERWLVCEVSR